MTASGAREPRGRPSASRAGTLAAAALLGIANMPAGAVAQDASVRFDVLSIGDTTVAFRLGRQEWVRPGMRALMVDPRRRDELVARLRVHFVTNDSAVAVVTGQRTPLVSDHVVWIDRPPVRFFRSWSFWGGLVGGMATGFIVGKL